MARFQDLETVKLRSAMSIYGFRAGNIGAVVMVCRQQLHAYEVEFVDDAGATIVILTLLEEELEAA